MRLSLLLLLTLPAVAAADVKLEWKFSPGDSFRMERVYRQVQEIEVKGRPYKQDTVSTWMTKVHVKDKSLGNFVLQLQMEDVTYKTTGIGSPSVFDDRLASRMKGLHLTLHVTSQGEVKKIQGYDEFVKKLSDGKADTEKVLRSLFPEEGMQETYEEVFAFLPRKTVAKGAKWKRSAIDPLPPFGSFKSQYEYTYEGMEDSLHAITYTLATAYQKPAEQPDLFRVVKGTLSGEEGKGKYLFDASTGRLVRGEKTMTVRGQLTLETSGVQSELRFVSTNQLKVRIVPPSK